MVNVEHQISQLLMLPYSPWSALAHSLFIEGSLEAEPEIGILEHMTYWMSSQD